MTTESKQDTRSGAPVLLGPATSYTGSRASHVPGLRVVARAAGLTVLAGGIVSVAAALVHGTEPAAAAALGAGLVTFVVSFGTLSLHVVASAMPKASLLVALVTYATQLAAVLLVFVAITRGDLFTGVEARGWLAASMVVATVVWAVAHLVLTARQRVPYFDLPTGGES